MLKNLKKGRILDYIKINAMFCTTVPKFLDLSRLDKRDSSYQSLSYIENDLKGNENWFELVRGSSYWG